MPKYPAACSHANGRSQGLRETREKLAEVALRPSVFVVSPELKRVWCIIKQ
jgi:hypothetical protein